MRVLLSFLGLLILAGAAFAQITDRASPLSEPVKWEAVGGKNNEFAVFMPAGYQSAGRPQYYLGRPDSGTAVKRHNTAFRYINGVILIMEYFEGNVLAIQESLIDRERLADVPAEDIGSFKVKFFTRSKHYIAKSQHFAIKDRLYVVKSIAKSVDDPISAAFFQSVRLMSRTGGIAPNAPPGTTTTTIPGIVEKEPIRLADKNAVSAMEFDRDAIIIYTPRPSFTSEERQGRQTASIKMRILLSSSGKVTDVEVVSSSGKMIERKATDAVRQTIFIPAEKDGQLVSTYRTISFGMEVGIR